MFRIEYSKAAIKDIAKLKTAGLSGKVRKLIALIEENPFSTPPSYEKLVGDLNGLYSRRINIKHRLVYMVDEKNAVIRILRMWSHYE